MVVVCKVNFSSMLKGAGSRIEILEKHAEFAQPAYRSFYLCACCVYQLLEGGLHNISCVVSNNWRHLGYRDVSDYVSLVPTESAVCFFMPQSKR